MSKVVSTMRYKTSMEKLTTKQCVQYIIQWYGKNRGILPIDVGGTPLNADGSCGGLGNGLKEKNWKRRAKVCIGGKTYRAFRPDLSVINMDYVVVLTEENGFITNLEYGLASNFIGNGKYFIKIEY